MVSLNVSALLFFCRAHTLVSKKSMDCLMFQSDFTADRNTGFRFAGLNIWLPAAVWEYEPTLLPLEPGSKDQPQA